MTVLAQAFPWLVVLATLLLFAVVIRLDRRISRGSQSAGPRHVERPKPIGLQQTPWELKAIDDQVKSGHGARARIELINTINRLSRAAGVDDPRYQLSPDAPNQSILWVVNQLETQLELGPLHGHFSPDAAPQASPGVGQPG